MEKRDFIIYHITFPNNETYVGSTSQPLNKRYAVYRNDAKTSKSPICQISTQYKFKEVSMVEVGKVKCVMGDPKVRILEEKWKKKLKPTLNVFKAYLSPSKRIKCFTHNHYKKTPNGPFNIAISGAKMQIRFYTKQNRPDMILKWEGILKERIQSRLDYQSS